MNILKCIVGFLCLGIFCLFDYGFASLIHYLTLDIHGGMPLLLGLMIGATIAPIFVFLLVFLCHTIGNFILGD